jgi:hypothetical protein
MDLSECKAIRDEVASMIARIEKYQHEQMTLNKDALAELAKYCKKIHPYFHGRFGNVGAKVSEISEATKRSAVEGDLSWVIRALKGMDIAILVHTTLSNNVSQPQSK